MENIRKNAYKHLLYVGFLHIRNLCQPREKIYIFNPARLHVKLKVCKSSGMISDWLHNLAQANCGDFDSFSENQFWSEYSNMKLRSPNLDLGRFEKIFECFLNGEIYYF